MLNILYAPHAVTRREALLKSLSDLVKKGEKTYLFVPEQQVLEAEGLLCTLNIQNHMEVSSFKRIANSIFRRFGGLRYHYIGKGAKQVVMWRALASVSSALREFTGVAADDLSMVRQFVSTVEEMKHYGVSPEQLEKAAKETEDEKLSGKLSDIALLYAAYNTILHEKHDDASDDLARAFSVAEGRGFFKDCHIVLDSFDGFTPAEADLLRLMLSEGLSVTVTLGYDKQDDRKIFMKLKETDRLVRKIAADLSVAVSEKSIPRGEEDREIGFLAKNIFAKHAEKAVFSQMAEDGHGVRVVKCPGMYEEARLIAADIARRVRNGARYRDFTVVARSTDRYLGVIDAALEGAGIPHFLSSRKDATAMPLVRMLFSAFDIHCYNWRMEDVIAYMRTGLSGLTVEECDILEEYAAIWKISGKRWYDDIGWQMNPSGFSLTFTEEDAKRLSHINELRERLVSPLTAFFEVFDMKPTARSVSAGLVYYLRALGIPAMLSSESEKDFAFFGSREEREEHALLYDLLLNLLDQLVEVAGDMVVSSREYSRLLYALVSEADIGKLPSRCDEVTVGNADLLRKSDMCYVYIMGLCQGEFPATDLETGCFDRDEKEELSLLGIETTPDVERRFADEKLYFYRALTGAKQSATLTYSYRTADGKEAFPSTVLVDTLALLAGREAEQYDELPVETLLYGAPDILEYAVRQGYSLDGISDAERGKYALIQPLSASSEELSPETAEALLTKKIYLTQSKIDQFVRCAFAYHCKYSLHLSEEANGSFAALDIGNYIHKVLEIFFSTIHDRVKEIDDEEAMTILEEIIAACAEEVCRGNKSKRMQYLIKRLRRMTRMLVGELLNEFRAGDFLPTFFELGINNKGGDSVKPELIPVGDGLYVTVTGVIDRVDTYRKGNDVYLRVVDYKTGSKTFSMADVEQGLGLQMLLYLFALSADQDGSLRKRLQCEGKLLPAGALYFSLAAKSVAASSRPKDEAESRKMTKQTVQRSGVLLKDAEILEAMESGLAGAYIPVTVKKGELSGANLYTLEELGRLSQKVEGIITSIAKELSGGKAAAKPLPNKQNPVCTYCKMKAICRTPESVGKEAQTTERVTIDAKGGDQNGEI